MQLYKLHSHLIRSHLHLIMSHNFSLSFNVGPNHFSFAFNSVPKMFLFAVPCVYDCRSIQWRSSSEDKYLLLQNVKQGLKITEIIFRYANTFNIWQNE